MFQKQLLLQAHLLPLPLDSLIFISLHFAENLKISFFRLKFDVRDEKTGYNKRVNATRDVVVTIQAAKSFVCALHYASLQYCYSFYMRNNDRINVASTELVKLLE